MMMMMMMMIANLDGHAADRIMADAAAAAVCSIDSQSVGRATLL
jgi:hypothetical protein